MDLNNADSPYHPNETLEKQTELYAETLNTCLNAVNYKSLKHRVLRIVVLGCPILIKPIYHYCLIRNLTQSILLCDKTSIGINGLNFYKKIGVKEVFFLELTTVELEQRVEAPNQLYISYIKSTFDVCCSVLLLICLIPLSLVVSVLIKLDSQGPVLFNQPRIGKNGREFRIYKFRTMYENVPKEGLSPVDSLDQRITKVGRLLRKTSLDELPQLINILKGEMSFVGPRPEQKSIVEQHYTSHEYARFLVKPGITGIWQISMDRTKPIHENLHHDFKYIHEISLVNDLKIIFKTIVVIFKSNTV
jgi:undecaprenyl phosphate N,N'-diacetylbacillosamine 1-phosphate transferase